MINFKKHYQTTKILIRKPINSYFELALQLSPTGFNCTLFNDLNFRKKKKKKEKKRDDVDPGEAGNH